MDQFRAIWHGPLHLFEREVLAIPHDSLTPPDRVVHDLIDPATGAVLLYCAESNEFTSGKR
jgi:hypothetical protein